MKNIIKLAGTIFICAFIGSCNKSEKAVIEVEEFPIEVNLKGSKLPLAQLCVSSLNVVDSMLLLIENCEENFIHAYSTKTYKYLGSFGRKGAGPAEFTFPETIGQYVQNENGTGVWIADMNKKVIKKVNVQQSLNKKPNAFGESYHIPTEAGRSNYMGFLADNTMVGTSLDGQGRLFFAKGDKHHLIEWVENFPAVDKKHPQEKLGVLYNSVMRIKPDGSRVVTALDLFKRIDVFKPGGELEFSIVFPEVKVEPDVANPGNRMEKDTRRFYSWLNVTDNYIYALNVDMSFEEYLNGDSDKSTTLEVFDWTGEPVCKYVFDQRIYAFAVDEQNRQIFGLNDKKIESQPYFVYKMGKELELLDKL